MKNTQGRPAIDPGKVGNLGLTTLDRFMAKVEITPDGHWIWTRATSARRAKFYVGGRRESGALYLEHPHAVAYRMLVGPIPEGYTLVRCAVDLCVSPDCTRIVPVRFAGKRKTLDLVPTLRREVRRERRARVTQQMLADEYGVTKQAIGYVLSGRINGALGFGKLSEADCQRIRERYRPLVSITKIGATLGISRNAAGKIARCATYRY